MPHVLRTPPYWGFAIAPALCQFLGLIYKRTSAAAGVDKDSGCGSYFICRKGHLEDGPFVEITTFCASFCLIYIWHWKFHPKRSVWKNNSIRILTFISILMIKSPVHVFLFFFLHWPILLNLLELHSLKMWIFQEGKKKKNQRTWFHFTPKCNLLKGLVTVILEETKMKPLLFFFFCFISVSAVIDADLPVWMSLMPSEVLWFTGSFL